jgi:hypothetical protein
VTRTNSTASRTVRRLCRWNRSHLAGFVVFLVAVVAYAAITWGGLAVAWLLLWLDTDRGQTALATAAHVLTVAWLITVAGAAAAGIAGPWRSSAAPRWAPRVRTLPELADIRADDTGKVLEQVVAELLDWLGFTSVAVTGGGGDLGRDVMGTDLSGRRWIFQCKAYDKPVGSPELQRFAGTCWTTHQADVAAVVTTSRYTLPAVRFARQSNILLIDGRMLTAWMKRSWSPVPSASRLSAA